MKIRKKIISALCERRENIHRCPFQEIDKECGSWVISVKNWINVMLFDIQNATKSNVK